MDTKSKIGIIFRNNSQWTGGVYYILNLIKCLHFLKADEKPIVYLFCYAESDFDLVKNETNYCYLEKVLVPPQIKYNFFERIMNKLSRVFFGKNLIEKRFNKPLDIIFPYTYDYFFDLISNKVYWLPDFQDRYLPGFFKEEELNSRKASQDQLAIGSKIVVFSSNDAKRDYLKFYPENNSRIFVLQFASSGKKAVDTDKLSDIVKKFNLPEKFFYSPNQFWAHKNHKLILQAVHLLKKQGVHTSVYFSGNENDYRNPGFIDKLKREVIELDLTDQVFFLGFIDIVEVFALMTIAVAVIQPSLFEGWSTVVEDAKSVNAYVLASDIGVHREQLDVNALFFDPLKAEQLAGVMKHMLENNVKKEPLDYSLNIACYANDLVQMIKEIKKS